MNFTKRQYITIKIPKAKFMKNIIIVLLICSTHLHISSQFINDQFSGSPKTRNAEISSLKSGTSNGQVNLFTGLYNYEYVLGTVSTPNGSLSYTAKLTYGSSAQGGTNMALMSGVPYGDGWNLEIPMISVGTEDYKKYTAYEEEWIETVEANKNKTNNYIKQNQNGSYSCDEAVEEGKLYWFNPTLNIPGVASGRLIFVKRKGTDNHFVLNKFDRYVEAILNGNTWRIILDDGTVYEMAIASIRQREAPNQKLQDPCFDFDNAVGSCVLPKTEILSWYCTSMYNRNKLGHIDFVYDAYGCFDQFPELNNGLMFNKLARKYKNLSSMEFNGRVYCSDIFLKYISAGKELLDFHYASIPMYVAEPNYILDFRNPGIQRYDSLYSFKHIYRVGINNGPESIPYGANFANWKRYKHIKKDAFISDFAYQHNPYVSKLSGIPFLIDEPVGTANEAKFGHGFLETPEFNKYEMINGDIYRMEFQIYKPFFDTDGLIDINIVTGKVLPIGSSECRLGDGECQFLTRRFKPIFSTIPRMVKWDLSAINNSNYMTMSGLFYGTPMHSNSSGIYVQIGPAMSDNLFSNNLCLNYQPPQVCNTYYMNLSYSWQADANMPRGYRSGDPIIGNFGIGLPVKQMQNFYKTLNYRGLVCSNPPLGDQRWWKEFNNPNCTFPNEPTYLLNDIQNSIKVVQASFIRYSKNPYMLRRVRKFVGNGIGDDYWKEVSNLEFKYDIAQLNHKVRISTNSVPNNDYNEFAFYKRNCVRLLEIIEMPRTIYNSSPGHSYPSTKFEYTQQHCIDKLFNFGGIGSHYNSPLELRDCNTDFYMLTKVTNPLGRETNIDYFRFDEEGTKTYKAFITDNALSRTIARYGEERSGANQNANLVKYPSIASSIIYNINFVVKTITETYSGGTRCYFYDYDSLTSLDVNTPMAGQFRTDAVRQLVQGFKKTRVHGPSPACYTGAFTDYYHHSDYLLWGKLYKIENFTSTIEKVSKTEIQYEPLIAYENASHKFKDLSGYTDYATYYTDLYRPLLHGQDDASFNSYYDSLMMHIREGNQPPPSAPVFTLYVPDENGNLILTSDCNCYDHYNFMDDIQKQSCADYFRLLMEWESETKILLDYEDEIFKINTKSLEGSFNDMTCYEGRYHADMIRNNPFLTFGYFIKKNKETTTNYENKCTTGIDSIINIKEYKYWDADFAGRPQSSGFKNYLTKMPEAHAVTGDSVLMYHPSFQLYSVKSYSPQLAGAYTLNEYFYLYDLVNDLKYSNGVGYQHQSYPLLWWLFNFIYDRSLMIHERVTVKAQGETEKVNSKYFLYNGGFEGLDDGFTEEEIENPYNNWPCPEKPRQRSVLDYLGRVYKGFPLNNIPSGLILGAIPNSIPNIPGLDTLAPYIHYNLNSKLLLKEIIRSTGLNGNGPVRLNPVLPILEYKLPTDTQVVLRVLEYHKEGVVRLTSNEKHQRTRYYYAPVDKKYFKDCQNGREVIGSFYVSNFIGQPVAITQGFNAPDSLRTEYTYRVEDSQLASMKDPNGMILSYEYDNYGRLNKSKRNGVTLERYEYNFFNNALNKNFGQRAEDNFVRKAIFNNSSDSTVYREYIDPLGNKISNTENFKVVSNEVFDIFDRPIVKLKPHVFYPFRTVIPPGLSLDEQIKFEYEPYPRSRVLKQSNFGTDLNNVHVKSFQYCIVDSVTLRSTLLSSGKLVLHLDNYLKGAKFRKTTATDEDGKITTSYHNSVGQLIALFTNNNQYSTLYDYDGFGNIKIVSNPKNQILQNNFNYLNLLYEKISPDEGTTQYAYDLANQIIAEKRAGETNPRNFVRDSYGRLIKQRVLTSTPPDLFNNNGLPWIFNKSYTLNNYNGVLETEYFYGDWDRSRQNLVHNSIFSKLPNSGLNGKLLGRIAQTFSYRSGVLQEIKYFRYNLNGFLDFDYHQFNNLGITGSAKGISFLSDFGDFNNSGSPGYINMDYGGNGMDFQYAYKYDAKNRYLKCYANYEDLKYNGSLFAEYTYHYLYDFLTSKELFGTGTPICSNNDRSCCTNVPIDKIFYYYDTRFRIVNSTSTLYNFDLTYDNVNNPYTNSRLSDNYNGNITSALNTYKLANTLNPPGNFTGGPKTAYEYQYDGQNRLMTANGTVENPGPSLGVNSGNGSLVGDELATYDPIGNFLTLHRGIVNSGCGTWNQASYNYAANKNWLNTVSNNILCPSSSKLLNFNYNPRGSLIAYSPKGITSTIYERGNYPISMNIAGFSAVRYGIGPDNNRIFKETIPVNGSSKREYYFNDFSGKTLAVLDQTNNKLKWYIFGNERIAEVDHNPIICLFKPPLPPPTQPPGEPLLDKYNPWEQYEYYLKTNSNNLQWFGKWGLGNFPNYITSTDRDAILASNNGLSEYLDEIIMHHDSLPVAKLLLPDTLLLLNINQQFIFKSARKHREDGMIGDTLRLQLIESPVSWITLNDTIESVSVPLNELLAISQGTVTVDSVLQLWTEAVQSSIPPHGKYYIYDHLQNTRVVYHIVCSAPNSTPPFRFELDQVLDYYPFGKILRQFTAPDRGVKYKSTAHERDQETDFDYRIARMYDAEIGRFLSVDPLADKYPNWNSYTYTLNNPITFVDPTGMSPEEGDGIENEYIRYKDANGKWVTKEISDKGKDEKDIIHTLHGTIPQKDAYYTTETFENYSGGERIIPGKFKLNFQLASGSAGEPLDFSNFIPGKAAIGGASLAFGLMIKKFSKEGVEDLSVEVLQRGGQSLLPQTLKTLNLTKEQGRFAIHALKKELNLPNNFHGIIGSKGEYIHPQSKILLGNIKNYLE